MTTTKTANEPTDTTTDSVWADQLAALKGRFPNVRDTILFAYHARCRPTPTSRSTT